MTDSDIEAEAPSTSVFNERRKRASRKVLKTKISHMAKQGRTVLSRELKRLMQLSWEGPLDKLDSMKLINYLKLLNDLDKIESRSADTTDVVSLKELEKLAAKADEP